VVTSARRAVAGLVLAVTIPHAAPLASVRPVGVQLVARAAPERRGAVHLARVPAAPVVLGVRPRGVQVATRAAPERRGVVHLARVPAAPVIPSVRPRGVQVAACTAPGRRGAVHLARVPAAPVVASVRPVGVQVAARLERAQRGVVHLARVPMAAAVVAGGPRPQAIQVSGRRELAVPGRAGGPGTLAAGGTTVVLPPPPGGGGGGPAEPPTQRVAIRRLRQAPHLGHEHQWVRFHRLAVDLETGVGLTTGQGDDPQVMVRWSDDGGHTWTDEQWTSAGRIGAYTTRAVWRRLGRARQRTFQVVISDPVKVAIVTAYLEVE
jgi:hypothetical protein